MKETIWHFLPIASVYRTLLSSAKGLTAKEAERRQHKFGLNKLPEQIKFSVFQIIINQIKSPLVYVLLGAAALTLVLQDYTDTTVILIAVFINTVLGFYQEYKANKSVEYLKKLIDYKARVLRNGNEIEIPSTHVVPGDILFLSAGDKIPADARLITIDSFEVVESSLTGESVPSVKSLKKINKGSGIGDRKNMVFSGTVVSKGKAVAVVVATGIHTELGKITRLVNSAEEENTPLQLQLSQFSKMLTIVVLAIGVFVVILGAVQGQPILGIGAEGKYGMINTAVALAVAAIPEGLLVSVTAILALGMQAIARQKALVRKLLAAETLGSVSIICTDKTGTLTEGKMQVGSIITANDEFVTKDKMHYVHSGKLQDQDLLMKISILCNDAAIENPDDQLEKWRIIGDPTETALVMGATAAGIPYNEIHASQQRLSEIPFDSEIKYMACLNRYSKKENVIYIKGAPEKVLEMCTRVRTKGKKNIFSEKQKKLFLKRIDSLTNQGLRVLAFSYKRVGENHKQLEESNLNSMIFAGLIALKDPLRKEAKETFYLAKKAGIQLVIVTGDHKLTAKAIVSELGISVPEKSVITGEELDKISDSRLNKIIRKIQIFARVEPRHKMRIINAWQKLNAVVAMTGDGVNDAPALKAADIGIALGSGTDVAKETADMILLDNNFKTIIAAIQRGRVIFDNIRKVVLYLLVDSFSEIVLIVSALIMGLPLPLLPAQIIWINLVADGLPNLALTAEKAEKEVMKDKPRKKNTKILNFEMKILITIITVVTNIVLVALFVFLLNVQEDIIHIRSIIFTAMAVDSLLYVFSCRSLRHSVFTQNPFSNPYLVLAVVVGFGLQIFGIYAPVMQRFLDVVPLSMYDWLIVVFLAVIKIICIEFLKFMLIVRKKSKENNVYA